MIKGRIEIRNYDEEELKDIFKYLGPNGKKVLLDVAKRLKIGMDKYGDFTDETKNMDNEAREELVDAIVYLTRGLGK